MLNEYQINFNILTSCANSITTNPQLSAILPTSGHFRGVYLHFQRKGHWEHCNEVCSLKNVECLLGFEPEASDSDCNLLTH